MTGAGVDALGAALRSMVARPRNTEAYPRLAVDRAFTLTGTGLVVTGTLVSGAIAVGDRLLLSPSGLELRVRGMHAQNRPAERAQAGQRVALNIAGPKLEKAAITRGDWVLHPDVHAPTSAIDARVRVLAEGRRPLASGAQFHLHLGAARVMARAAVLDAPRAEPGDSALLRLSLDRPIGALWGDRLVLRDPAATRTIGGGAVVDPFPPRRGRRSKERLEQLAALEHPDPAGALGRLLSAGPGWTDSATFFRARNLRPESRGEGVRRAPAILVANALIAPRSLEALRTAIAALLKAHHAAAPDEPGLQPERLRQRLPERVPPALFRALMDGLLRQGSIEQDGPWLRLPSHRASLSPEQERLWRRRAR